MIKIITTKKFTVTYEYDREMSPNVTFKAYEIVGHERGEGEAFDVPIYLIKGANDSSQDTKDLKDASIFVEGFVKWDGCCHYTFGDGDGYLHLCGKESVEDLSKLVTEILYQCISIMGPNFNDY